MSAIPDEEFLNANLTALCATLPQTECERLRRTEPSAEATVVETKSGLPTLFAFGRYTYSRHDPQREARRLVESEIPRKTESCVFYNIGLAYHVEAFLDAFPRSRAIVIEPDLEWLVTALASRDLRHLLKNPRLILALEMDPAAIVQILDDSPHSPVHVVRLRALAEKSPAYFERVDSQLGAMLSRREINTNTLARFGRLWVRNLAQNMELVATSPGVQRLAGAFAGVPALILAAGPSLDEVLPLLSRLRERLLVVSVDTSYRAAVAAGVIPDFLLVVDPQYWNSRHLDRHPSDKSVLVSESSTYPGIFRHSRGVPLYLCGSLFPLGSYLEREVDTKGRLGAGGSVSTTAWDFVRTLGCSPIVFAGLDLGFPDLKTHFRGGFFEERAHLLAARAFPAETQAFHALHDADPFSEPNNSGGRTLTDRRLVIYRWWFENQLAIHPEAQSFTLSPQGIKIDGLKLCGVSDLFEHPIARPQIDEILSSLRTTGPPAAHQVAKLRQAVEKLLADLATLRDTARAGVSASRDLLRTVDEGGPVGPILRRLEAVDQRILGLASKEVAEFLVHKAAQEILDRPEPKGGREVASNSADLYGSLLESALFNIEQISRALARLEEAPNREGGSMTPYAAKH